VQALEDSISAFEIQFVHESLFTRLGRSGKVRPG
jgi:hypothetical protein